MFTMNKAKCSYPKPKRNSDYHLFNDISHVIKKMVIACPILKKDVEADFDWASAGGAEGDGEYQESYSYAYIIVHCSCGFSHKITLVLDS